MKMCMPVEKEILFPEIETLACLIQKTQKQNGEIPWSDGDKTDPWDHVESIMGLSIGGYFHEAKRAFYWLAEHQLEDGSWYAAYQDSVPTDLTRDANMSTYIAVGLFHYYLITKDQSFLKEMWDTMARAIDFAMGLQANGGEIYWAINPEGKIDPMALLTGSSSMYLSIKCAIAISRILNRKQPAWEEGLYKLGDAISHRPHVFNISKSRYSMDWYYPILSGALTGDSAQNRLKKYWKKFVVDGMGIRCVSDQPWVTIAETSEFVLSLYAMGNSGLAQIVFNWIQTRKYDDGSFYCGFTFPDMVIWPDVKYTWTNAVALMAADALYNLTPATNFLSHDFWANILS
ncbi:MAG: phenyltransferase domain-containing protein [Desulfobacterales bacterium]|nr:phenyltransferase domain-containing protein [Desulfobacterales bacterium]